MGKEIPFEEPIVSEDGLQFYRCILCGSVVSPWDVKKHHGCGKCGNARIRPSELSAWEKIVQICRHPAVWKWKEAKLD